MGTPTVTWDAAFKNTPAGSDDPRNADDRIRELKLAIEERWLREHQNDPTEASARHGIHRAGSARAFYQTGSPTTAPDGTGTRAWAATDDAGRLHVDKTTKLMKVLTDAGTPVWEYPIADGGIHLKKIDIGDWNMDSTSNVSVAHGLTVAKIVGITSMVRNDDDTMRWSLTYVTVGGFSGWADYVDASNVILARSPGGVFDNSSFDSTSYNRGWIFVWYVD